MAIHTELNIPPGPKVRLVLDHLNSALHSVFRGYNGRAGFRDDGVFEAELTGDFPVGDDKVTLTWRVTKLPDGTLNAVHVEPKAPSDTNTAWEREAHGLIDRVLAASLVGNLKKLFRRELYFYVWGQLDGEYWLPGFRFAPAHLDDPQPNILNAERVVCFDMHVEAVDEMHADNIAVVKARRLSARLSLLLDLGLYQPRSALRWMSICDAQGRPTGEVRRCRPASPTDRSQYDEMPKKGELCPLGKYAGCLRMRFWVPGRLLSLPPETRKILRGVDTLEPRIAEAFDGCAGLYQVAVVVGDQFPSVGLAYRIAAVDAIVKANPEYKSVPDFIEAHAPSYPDAGALARDLYGSARSAHFHAGVFPMGEYDVGSFSAPFSDSDDIKRIDMQFKVYQITREAIVGWIIHSIPELQTDEQPGHSGSPAAKGPSSA